MTLGFGLISLCSLVCAQPGPIAGDYGEPQVLVAAPDDARLAHLAWPKLTRTADGFVLAYVAARAHTVDGCPAVSVSTDGGHSFSRPQVVREFSKQDEYAHCGNVALGTADDGAVVLLAMAFTGNQRNTIFGWRSTDSGRTWQPSDTSALGPDKTGSVYGNVFSVPGKGLAVCGHYRKPSQPYSDGVWIAFSKDQGKTWGPAQRITDQRLFEPAVIFAAGRIVGLFRDSAKPYRYWQAVSDDLGETWKVEPASIANESTKYGQPSPFITCDPREPSRLYAMQSFRGVKGEHRGEIWLWTADARQLDWKRLGLVAALPKDAKEHNDWSYPWMAPCGDGRWLAVFYSGNVAGANSIYGLTLRP